MKKTLTTLTALILILSLLFCAMGEESAYSTLQKGDSGEEVLKLKQAMYYLGYFSSQKFSDVYNDTMVERIEQLQKNNGLPVTGIADPALQELVYSGNCIKTKTAPKPTDVPAAPLTDSGWPEDLPALTEEGFLPADAGIGEYVYANAADGLWLYYSPSLAIEIRKYTDKADINVWFECDIKTSPETPLSTYLNWSKSGKTVVGKKPAVLAKENHLVLAFSDDHFGTRKQGKTTVGLVIRGGKIISEKTYASGKGAFPNLEVLALFDDGSMKTYESSAMTAQEYLDAGVTDTFAFGPILVQDGKLGENMLKKDYYHYREPRLALGMIEPYHYIVLAVNGRSKDNTARGVYLNWLADKMLEKGAAEAINLDGGGTVSLMFMGKRINSTGSDERYLYSCIGIGTSDQVPEK